MSTALDVAGREEEVVAAVRALLGSGQGKDREESTTAREEGNRHFQAGRLPQALGCYNRAVVRAPWPGQEAALALGNRSAVLAKAKMHSHVVEDLTLALETGYPAHLAYKAWQRLAVAYEGMGRLRKAREAYNSLLVSFDHSDIPSEKIGKMQREAKLALETLGLDTAEVQVQDVLPLPGSHIEVPSLSDKVELRRGEVKGRHLVAKEVVEPGEVVSREEALAMSLDPRLAGSHCDYCLVFTPAPLPCPSCSHTVFCSTACLQAGLPSHSTSCRLLSGPLLSSLATRADQSTTRLLLTLDILLSQTLEFHLSHTTDPPSSVSPTPYSRLLFMEQHLAHLPLPRHLASTLLLLYILRLLDYLPGAITSKQEISFCVLIAKIHAAVKPNIHATFQVNLVSRFW